MSDGTIHVKASLVLAAGFGVGTLISQDVRLLECTVGALAGVFLTPDLDVDKTYIGNRIIKKRVGWFAERMWNGFWMGYKKSFKHGQFASHFPVFSTFIRLSYAYFWLIFVTHSIIYLSFNPAWDLMYVLSWYATLFFSPMFFVGLASSDLIHYSLDIMTTEKKI